MIEFLTDSVFFWGIVALIVASFGVFIDRMLRLRKIAIDPQDFLQGIFNVLDKGQTAEALAICDETPGPLAALVAEAVVHAESDEAHLREVLAATAHAELSRLERRAMLLSLFAQILPLLGLIGTLFGGFLAVSAIDARAPLIRPGLTVEAISSALGTSLAGLIGATFCYVAHHILVLRTDALCLDMDMGMALMLEYLARNEGLPTQSAGESAEA